MGKDTVMRVEQTYAFVCSTYIDRLKLGRNRISIQKDSEGTPNSWDDHKVVMAGGGELINRSW